jgi:hypothetical protein
MKGIYIMGKSRRRFEDEEEFGNQDHRRNVNLNRLDKIQDGFKFNPSFNVEEDDFNKKDYRKNKRR